MLLKCFLYIGVSLTLLSCQMHTRSLQTHAQEKSDYCESDDKDNTVTVSLGLTPNREESGRAISKARSFIWCHWRSKIEGKLIYETYTKEGEKNIRIFNIVTNEEGQWQISVKKEGQVRTQKSELNKDNKTTDFVSFQIDRIEFNQNELRKKKVIPEDSERLPTTYIIRFLNKNGSVIFEL